MRGDFEKRRNTLGAKTPFGNTTARFWPKPLNLEGKTLFAYLTDAKEIEKTHSSMLNVTASIDMQQPELPNLKKYSSKAYSFGLGRGEVFKTHVNEVYQQATTGRAIPGPGTYTPPPMLGNDSPKYTIKNPSALAQSKL